MKKLISVLSIAAMIFCFSNLNAQYTGGKGTKDGGLVKTVVAVTGKVLHAETKDAASVKITVCDENGKKINSATSNATTGYYYVTKLKPGKIYFLSIQDEKYLSEKIEMRIPETDSYDEFSRDIVVYPKNSSSKIKINVPPFEIGKSKIKYGYAVVMEDYLNLMISNPNVNFTVMCFPDDNDNPAENMKLTKMRADNIRDFFSINGVDPSRITIKGHTTVDPDNPKPMEKAAKGKRYIGTTYLILD
jgi:outer membrane protein OmpA-like peptidoglycan-associated protein